MAALALSGLGHAASPSVLPSKGCQCRLGLRRILPSRGARYRRKHARAEIPRTAPTPTTAIFSSCFVMADACIHEGRAGCDNAERGRTNPKLRAQNEAGRPESRFFGFVSQRNFLTSTPFRPQGRAGCAAFPRGLLAHPTLRRPGRELPRWSASHAHPAIIMLSNCARISRVERMFRSLRMATRCLCSDRDGHKTVIDIQDARARLRRTRPWHTPQRCGSRQVAKGRTKADRNGYVFRILYVGIRGRERPCPANQYREC
jgi:hypothetical protein